MNSVIESQANEMVNLYGANADFSSVYWNPFNFVVQCHKTGKVDMLATDRCRLLLGLPAYRHHDKLQDAGRKPVELTMENIRRAQSIRFTPSRSSHLRSSNYHYSDSWEAIGIMARMPANVAFTQYDNALFACAMLASYERLNARLEVDRKAFRDAILGFQGAVDQMVRDVKNQRVMAEYSFRMLEAGEVIKEGDEFCSGQPGSDLSKWSPVTATVGDKLGVSSVGYFRRRLAPYTTEQLKAAEHGLNYGSNLSFKSVGLLPEYRLLQAGEKVIKGDEVRDAIHPQWTPVSLAIGGQVPPSCVGHFRRKVEPIGLLPEYRFVHPGEVIEAGDEWKSDYGDKVEWKPVTWTIGQKYNSPLGEFRRRVHADWATAPYVAPESPFVVAMRQQYAALAARRAAAYEAELIWMSDRAIC